LKYRIEARRSAAKALKKIPKPDRKRISEKIDSLEEKLPNHDITKMKGDNPFHKVRPLKNGNFCSSSRKAKISTTGIY